jgi:hypothetical protein
MKCCSMFPGCALPPFGIQQMNSSEVMDVSIVLQAEDKRQARPLFQVNYTATFVVIYVSIVSMVTQPPPPP